MVLSPEPLLCEVKLHTVWGCASFFYSQYAHIQETQGQTRESPDSDGKVWRGYTTKVKPTLAVSYPKLLDFPERLSSQVMLWSRHWTLSLLPYIDLGKPCQHCRDYSLGEPHSQLLSVLLMPAVLHPFFKTLNLIFPWVLRWDAMWIAKGKGTCRCSWWAHFKDFCKKALIKRSMGTPPH